MKKSSHVCVRVYEYKKKKRVNGTVVNWVLTHSFQTKVHTHTTNLQKIDGSALLMTCQEDVQNQKQLQHHTFQQLQHHTFQHQLKIK